MPSKPAKKPPAKFKETAQARQERAIEILRRLHKLYPEATCALEHKSALHLLTATILSAQCTDDRVNKVTPGLFRKYPTAADFAKAIPEQLEELIRSTGFFRNKAKSLMGAGRVIIEKFSGQVPDTMESLLELPGVARKTANVVLGTWFGKNEGVVVDTHVGRLSHRLRLTWRSKNEKDAVRIEQDLMEVIPRSEWTYLSHSLIWHGRKVCSARGPKCADCTLNDVCPSAFSFDKAPPAKKKARKSQGK